MTTRFDAEQVDLANVAQMLRDGCGEFVEGNVVGRTRVRDLVAAHLGCSFLEAERVVDTMAGRGFIVEVEQPNGQAGWQIRQR